MAEREPRFIEIAGRGGPGPILLSSPHSGTVYPEGATDALAVDAASLRCLEDGPTHLIASRACAEGAALIGARYARAYVDLNRGPLEVDVALLGRDPPPGHLLATAKVQAGLGVVPSRLGSRAIYREPLGAASLRERLARGWAPYHRRLAELARQRVAAFGTAVLLDLHSMPAEAAYSAPGGPIDVSLGDRHGTSCDRRLVERACLALRAEGLAVARNRPYAGAFIAEHYGRPERCVHALQLEFRRDLFMDPETHRPHAGLEALAGALARVARALGALARELPGLAPCAARAEAEGPPIDLPWPETLRAAD